MSGARLDWAFSDDDIACNLERPSISNASSVRCNVDMTCSTLLESSRGMSADMKASFGSVLEVEGSSPASKLTRRPYESWTTNQSDWRDSG